MQERCAVIFGGVGFIGAHFADRLSKSREFSKIYLFDIEPADAKASAYRRGLIAENSMIEEVLGDVRNSITWMPVEAVGLIANFAAVHREPGHVDAEYFETNLRGAENICEWATRVSCERMIFTSSISPYGVSETVKNEGTLPVPVTAYGASKLAAEKIHQIWQAKEKSSRFLTIVRPGVVFGPSEGGNVTRLVKAVRHGYFVYTGNKSTRKAGIYVKELVEAIFWTCSLQRQPGVVLFNGAMNPGPSVEEYVASASEVLGTKNRVFSIPYGVLIAIAHFIETVLKPFGVKHPFSPVRIRKLVRSNNVQPLFLSENGYVFKYSLTTAMVDWKNSSPEDWK